MLFRHKKYLEACDRTCLDRGVREVLKEIYSVLEIVTYIAPEVSIRL